jgi:hypothetical protein
MGHVAHMGRKELHSGFFWVNLRETSLYRRIKLKQILNEWDRRAWTTG